jgi:hypothetical protein
VHHGPLGQRPTTGILSKVAASNPSSRWLAGAGTAPSGTPPATVATALEALFAAVDRAGPSGLAAAGRLGGAGVYRQLLQFQAGHAVVGGQHRQA